MKRVRLIKLKIFKSGFLYLVFEQIKLLVIIKIFKLSFKENQSSSQQS